MSDCVLYCSWLSFVVPARYFFFYCLCTYGRLAFYLLSHFDSGAVLLSLLLCTYGRLIVSSFSGTFVASFFFLLWYGRLVIALLLSSFCTYGRLYLPLSFFQWLRRRKMQAVVNDLLWSICYPTLQCWHWYVLAATYY